MGQASTTTTTHPLGPSTAVTRRKVLVTGAAGRIGSSFAQHAHEKYDLRLMVRGTEPTLDAIRPFGEVVTGELSDLARMKEICSGVDVVLHLAGNPNASATWSDLLNANIIGSYHAMVAAHSQGVKRLVYASSIHAVSGYPVDAQVKTSEPVNPGDLYGVSKCFGEALGRYMAEQEGMSVIAVRIGAFKPAEDLLQHDERGTLDATRQFDAWVSPRDLHQLFERCIDAGDHLKFAIVHGLSDGRFKRLDISDARELLGYQPVDDLTAIHPIVAPLGLAENIATHSQRGDADLKPGIREEH